MKRDLIPDNTHKYDDILYFPHHRSKNHKHMDLYDRAAQFAPFAALVGLDEQMNETARRTDKKRELSDEEQLRIGTALAKIREKSTASVKVIYFIDDEKKKGGRYEVVCGEVKKVDEYRKIIVVGDKQIRFDNIADIE